MKFIKYMLIFGTVVVSGYLSLLLLLNLDREILIQSIESKTSKGDNIYNKISYEQKDSLDIWKMKQNHTDLKGEWDELKIIVETDKRPFVARYFQMKKGKEVEFRVSCYKCHANGPRAIRADFKSKLIQNTLLDRLQVYALNLKIKHYGEIKTPQNIKLAGEYRKVPLKHTGMLANKKVKHNSCSLCHGEGSFLKRSSLTLQQKHTILHLIKTKQMPPWPFKLSGDEIENLVKQLGI